MKLQPALIFGEHMVLQRNKEIKVFGTSAAGDTVSVTLCGETVSAPAVDGVWVATLGAKEACERTVLTISSEVTGEKIIFEDVAIGEVWLAGGQSNMEFLMKYEYDFEAASKLANDDILRYFCYPQTAYKGFMETENNCPNWGFWRKWDTIENRKQFSAVAGYMAMFLRKKLDVPVGIVACNWGGTPAAAWTAHEDLEANPALKAVLDWHESELQNINWSKYIPASEKKAAPRNPEMDAVFERMMMGEDVSEFFEKTFDPSSLMQADFVPFLPGPRSTVRPSGLYENMLAKVAPYTIRGAVWYQGEDDDAREWAYFYDESMKTMIGSWRTLWGYDFPFYQVELAPYKGFGPVAAKDYPLIRHQQAKAAAETPDSYDICILDAGEALNIHPRHKKVVGERLGRVVMKHTYGDASLVADCPRAVGARRADDAVTILFENEGEGIAVRGDLREVLQITQEGVVKEYRAEADGDRLVLKGDFEEGKAVMVKYCEENYCNAVLFNSEDNPVYGFTFEI